VWNELWQRHRGKLLGVACGLFLSFVYLFAGFWDMLIVAFILFLGFLVGKQADERKLAPRLEQFLDWLNERWRPFR